MKTTDRTGSTRRQFLSGATAGMASWLALGKAPAFAQKRELTFLSWNHFVPAADDELRKQAEAFGKANNCTVRVDTMAHLQMPSKIAAEAQSQSGHDMYRTASADPFLYENLLVSMDDVVAKVGKQGGGWYNFAAESCQTKSGWKAIPWFWVSFPGTYNMAHYKKAGLEHPPKTWDELLKQGKILKKQGNPVGIAISHCSDAHSTYWSVAWSYGAKVLEADGKTIAINSPKMVEVIEYYKELYAEAMEPEVLSWDDAGNNRCLNAGRCAWIHNPVSPYAVAIDKKLPIADDINHHSTPAGPAGRFFAPNARAYGIWKFSKNIELAKDLLRFLFREDNLREWIQAGNGFNHPMWRYWEKHPVWNTDPKLKMLPAEGAFGRMRGWPASPSDVFGVIDDLYILPNMVAKAIGGMSTKDAMAWATDQVKRILATTR